MEKFIIGLFSEQLSTYIHGFRKEQLNANLLNGKGEISDVQINVKPVNDILKRYTSLIELSSVYLSKLNFNVTSFRHIKKAPIEVAIDEVHIVLVEPLQSQGPGTSAWNTLNLSWNEIAKQIVLQKANKSAPYGLLERIQDNITLDIHRVYVTFQTLGKFKTRTWGEWTPPALSLLFNQLRYVSVDEYGEEGTPDDVWRHNTRTGRQEAALRYATVTGEKVRSLRHRTIMIYKKVSMEMSVAVGYQYRNGTDGDGDGDGDGDADADGVVSAKDTFMKSRVVLRNLPLQSHFCLHRRIRDNAILAVQVDLSLMNLEVEIDPDVLPLLIHVLAGLVFCFQRGESYVDPFSKGDGAGDGDGDGGDVNGGSATLDHSGHAAGLHDQEEENKQSEVATMDLPIDEEEEYDEDDLTSGDDASELNTSNVTENTTDEEKWPVLVLPAGLIVVEKISLSVSIHHIGLRIRYSSDMDGYLQLTMKGFMAELIWPKETLSPNDGLGGFVQMSMAYINVQETHGKVTQQIMHGGHHFGNEKGEFVAKETSAEEMFPMFESSGIRNHHLDLRSTFPVQVFGWKTTIDILGKEKLLSLTSPMSMLHEIGINDVVLTILPETSVRLSKFIDQSKGLVDRKWFSGDWSVETGLNDIEKYLSHGKQEINAEIAFSPELMNITAKMCGIDIHLPPLTKNDLRSGTLTMSLSESMIIVSPSLPRLFLSEDVPTNVHNPERSAFSAQFPNDSKDGSYEDDMQLEQLARIQMTLNDFSLRFKPSLPCYDALESNQLFAVTKVVVLGSYENSKEEIKGACAHLFVSTLIQNANLNIDFNVLSSVVAAVASHKDTLSQRESTDVFQHISDLAGPVNIIARGSITEFNFRIWRQHLCLGEQNGKSQTISLPVVLLLRYNLEDVEIGVRLFFKDSTHEVNPFCVKSSIGKMGLFTNKLNFTKASTDIKERSSKVKDSDEVSIFLFGAGILDENHSQSILIRVEKWTETGRFEVGVAMKSGEVTISEQLDTILTLIIEGALHPEWSAFPFVSSLFSDHRNKPRREQSLDWRLQILSAVLCVDPDQIDFVNVNVQIENMCFCVPYQNKKVVLASEKLHLCSGYLRSNDISAVHCNEWETIYRDKTSGFHHIISSTQKCLLHRKSEAKLADEIISTFSVNTYFHPTNLRTTLNDCSLSLEEWIIWEELYAAGRVYRDKFTALYTEVVHSITEFKAKLFIAEERTSQAPYSNTAQKKSPLSLVYDASRNELNVTSKLLSEMKENVLLHEQRFHKVSKQNGEEFLKLRGHLLQTELDRMAAYSLISHEMSGFIRIGGTAMSGQRFVNFTNFWRHFVVLKGSNLVIFKDTTQTKPLYLISLVDATIHSVSGSGAKRIFSRAFALVELSGKKTFFIAPTYEEFESWVKALRSAIGGNKGQLPPNESSTEVSQGNEERLLPTEFTRDPNNQSTEDTPNLDVIAPTNFDDFRGTIVSFDESSFDLTASESGEAIQQEFPRDGPVASISEDGFEDSISISSALDEHGPSSDKRGAKFRDRMAKMKASVKNNVKTMNENVKNMKTENRVARRQRVGSSSARMVSSSTSMKLKHVKANDDEPNTKEAVKIASNQELHLIPDIWRCQVKIDIATKKVDGHKAPSSRQEPSAFLPDEGTKETFLRLDIKLSSCNITDNNESAVIHLTKTFSELLDLHATVSATLIAIQQNPQAASLEILESGGYEELFSHMINSGKVLQGLIHLANSEYPKNFDHIGSVISAFINALFSNPIPTTVFNAVLAFFDIQDVALVDTIFKISKNPWLDVAATEYGPNTTTDVPNMSEILSLLHNCEVSVARTERYLTRARILSATKHPILTTPNQREIVRTSTSSSQMKNEIMQDALTSVMLERDEAHSALVSSRVFHAHQVDQQRRKINMLESRIRFMEESSNVNSAPAAAFFLGDEVFPHIDSVTKIEKEMIQNVDVELLELCRQLSSAISSRVAAELEIVRMKESRRVEHAVEAATQSQVEEELSRYRNEAETELRRRLAAEEELQKWKKSYELMEYEAASTSETQS